MLAELKVAVSAPMAHHHGLAAYPAQSSPKRSDAPLFVSLQIMGAIGGGGSGEGAVGGSGGRSGGSGSEGGNGSSGGSGCVAPPPQAQHRRTDVKSESS